MERRPVADRLLRWVRGVGDEAADPVGADDGAAGRTDAAGATAGPGGGTIPPLADLRARLQAVVRPDRPVPAGCLHLIGLGELAERLGPRWDKVRERVHQLAERMIQRHVGPADVWFRYGEADFVIVFAALAKTEAQLVCGKIMQELHQTLLGDSDTRTITVRTVVADLSDDMAVEAVTLSDLLRQAAGLAGTAGAATAAGAAGPAAADAAADSRERLAQIAAQDGTRREPLQPLYAPVWDIRHQVLSTYLCRVNRRRPGRSDGWGYEALGDAAGAAEYLELDLNVLCHSVTMLDELYRNRFRMVLALPVHFETVAVAARRRDFHQVCRAIPEHLHAMLSFQLCGLPEGVPYGRMAELVNAVRPFCRLVMAEVPRFQTADLANLSAAGVTIAVTAVPPRAGEAKTMAEIERFAIGASKAGLHAMVTDIATSSLALASQAAGVTFVGGGIIGEWVEVPETMIRFTWEDVYVRPRLRGRARRRPNPV